MLAAPLVTPVLASCFPDRTLGPAFSASAADGPVVLIGAGDQHAVASNNAHRTGRVIQSMLDAEPNAYAFALGDLVQDGTAQQYRDYYDKAWGGFKERTFPMVGNHDRKDPANSAAQSYYGYWGEQAGAPGKGYYAKTLGAWRCYFLNSEQVRPEQVEYLQADLPLYADKHIMAMWHTPVFATPCLHNSGKSMAWPGTVGPGGFWQVLQEHKAEFVVSGHVHRYERFRRMLRDSTITSAGIRQFVVGIAGVSPMEPFSTLLPTNCEQRVVTRGVMRFELHADRYEWRFTDLNGVVRDSGAQACRKTLVA